MPCNSDYLTQNDTEFEYQRVAKLLVFIYKKLDIEQSIPEWILQQADKYYANDDRLIPFLCKMLKSLNPIQMNEIVYDGRNKTSRDLADWWDEHLEADEARERLEAERKYDDEIKKIALKKLTAEEKRILNVR